MLVLSRRLGEKIQIADNVTIKVIGITGSRVRLAIEAPREVTIYRTDLLPVPVPSQTNQRLEVAVS